MEKITVSFCTPVMNRLHHLRQTLSVNIADNDEPGVQFVILDYNSTDGLENYIYSHFREEIQTGKLKYCKNCKADNFDRSAAKNEAMLLGDGDILCNIDADHYTGCRFADYVTGLFNRNENIFLTGLYNPHGVVDSSGRLCLKKDDFFKVTGFDESFQGHGFEDYDMVNRLILCGINGVIIDDINFLKALKHADKERFSNDKTYRLLDSVLVNNIDDAHNELLFLFRDGTYKWGLIFTTNATPSKLDKSYGSVTFYSYKYELEGGWRSGSWVDLGGFLAFDGDIVINLRKNTEGPLHFTLFNENRCFLPFNSEEKIHEVYLFYTQLNNRIRMITNLEYRIIRPNLKFGEANVNERPLSLQLETA